MKTMLNLSFAAVTSLCSLSSFATTTFNVPDADGSTQKSLIVINGQTAEFKNWGKDGENHSGLIAIEQQKGAYELLNFDNTDCTITLEPVSGNEFTYRYCGNRDIE